MRPTCVRGTRAIPCSTSHDAQTHGSASERYHIGVDVESGFGSGREQNPNAMFCTSDCARERGAAQITLREKAISSPSKEVPGRLSR
jgi:hypothetical protein